MSHYNAPTYTPTYLSHYNAIIPFSASDEIKMQDVLQLNNAVVLNRQPLENKIFFEIKKLVNCHESRFLN